MRGDDMIAEMRAAMEQAVAPWRVFIGLIELRRSEMAPTTSIYAVHPAFLEMSPMILIHPDLVEQAREVAMSVSGKSISDAELAAWLYWSIHHQRNKEKRG